MGRSRRFQTVPIQVVGGSMPSRSTPISSQKTYNLYPESTPTGISPSALLSFPGWAFELPDYGVSACKGCYFWNSLLYYVKGGNLYSYNQGGFGTETLIGAVSGPSRTYSFSDNGTVMVIATGGSLYVYDGTTLSTEDSVTWSPKVVRFLNERFITDGDDGGTYSSDVLSTNFDIANIFYTRSSTDAAVGPYVFNQIVYGFGERSVEPWEESAGAPPYSRMNGGIIETVGAASIFGIANSDDFVYFMGSDAIVYRMSSFTAEPISTPSISTHFRTLSFSDVKADSFTWDGHRFILFTFFGNDESWVFDETTGQWFEIGGQGGTRSLAFNLISGWNSNIYGVDYANGSLWRLQDDYHLNALESVERIRTISCISGDDFGSPQSTLEMSKLVLNMETGNPVDPQTYPSTYAGTPDPILQVECSFDGGYTYSKTINVRLGDQGDFTKPLEVHLMKQFKRAVFRLTITDPIRKYAIYGAAIDVREAGY